MDAAVISAAAVVAPLWTIKDVAKYIGKSERWVWRAITKRSEEAGSIPHIRIGASPRFFQADIEAWVSSGCPSATTIKTWKQAEEKRRRRA